MEPSDLYNFTCDFAKCERSLESEDCVTKNEPSMSKSLISRIPEVLHTCVSIEIETMFYLFIHFQASKFELLFAFTKFVQRFATFAPFQ